MRHKVAGRRLSRPTAQRQALFRNLATDLLRHEKIITTEAKAKEVRSLVEKMVTLGKKGDLSSRRRALAFILDENVVDKVFSELASRYTERNGGYTRLTKLAPRLGDGAAMAKLELI